MVEHYGDFERVKGALSVGELTPELAGGNAEVALVDIGSRRARE
jgi:hypothetical protein